MEGLMYQVRYYHIAKAHWFSHDFTTYQGAINCARHHAKRSDVGAIEIWAPGDTEPTVWEG